MIKIQNACWVNKDKIQIVFVKEGTLQIQTTNTTIYNVDKDYEINFCKIVNVSLVDITKMKRKTM